MAESQLFLGDSNSSSMCHIHPLVIMSILDHYVRRNDTQERVIGTLLGFQTADGTTEIRGCFPVPHSEGENVGVDMAFHRSMYELQRRANPKETIVGWYSTGCDVNENSVLIHNFFWNEMSASPVHLTVDSELSSGHMRIQTLVSTSVSLTDSEKRHTTVFRPVPHQVLTRDTEKAGLEVLLRSKENPSNPVALLTELGALEQSLMKLDEMLSTINEYVEKVLNGAIPVDNKVGRFLLNCIESIPRIDSAAFNKMLNTSLQDLLMVVYLSNLTRAQLKIAEKLQNVF